MVDSTINTEIGPLTANNLNGGAELDVLVRPDDVVITPRANGIGQIILRRFRGGENLYCVQLPSGRRIHSHQPGRDIYEPGTRVDVSVRVTELVTFPRPRQPQFCNHRPLAFAQTPDLFEFPLWRSVDL